MLLYLNILVLLLLQPALSSPALLTTPSRGCPTHVSVDHCLFQAPCRKLLTTLIQGLVAHLFNADHDIYMPNCDKRGFFRKKQCWSSRGKRRGKCWCVDKNGMPVSSNTKQRGGLSC